MHQHLQHLWSALWMQLSTRTHAFQLSLRPVAALMLVAYLLASISYAKAEPVPTTKSINQECPEIKLPAFDLDLTPVGQPLSVFITASPAGNYQYTVVETYGNSFVEGNYSLDSTTGELKIVAIKREPQHQDIYIIVRATDSNGCFTEKYYGFICPTITFPDTIPPMIAGQPYNASVAASPAGNYVYLAVDEFLPTGLSLDTLTGIVSGTPRRRYDSGSFTIKAVNAGYCTAEKRYQYYVARGPVTVDFADSLPKGRVGQTYFASLGHIGLYYADDTPPGIHFNDLSGELSGIPTKAGTYEFDVYEKYSDVGLNYTIVIEEACFSLPDSAPAITTGKPYSASFAASPAGSYTYSYQVTEEEYNYLPQGLSFNTTTGELSGVPVLGSPGSFGFEITITATNANGCQYSRLYKVASVCPLVLPATIPNGHVGVAYTANIKVMNETGPFTYSATNHLPAGLYVDSTTGEIKGTPTTAGTYYFVIDVTGYCYTGKVYTLTIAPATTGCTASGNILRETWVKVKGYDVRTIPVNTTPTATRQLTRFEGPSNVTNEYGDRIRGYICPPTSGNYTFWIASDDNGVLYLSSNDQAATKQRIAWVNGATKPQEWTKFASQQSAPIYLEAGKKYYIESLHKEAYGNDHIAVGWQMPGGTLERPIPGKRLSPFVAPTARTADSEEAVEQAQASVASLSAAPNPFSDQTTIHFTAQVAGKGSVVVYDLNGSVVKVLFDGELEEGETKELTLEGAALLSGVYLVKATSPTGVSHLKLVLAK